MPTKTHEMVQKLPGKVTKVGIQRRGHNWRAFIRINGRLYAKTFPITTTLAVMQHWRQHQRAIAPLRSLTVRETAHLWAVVRETAARDLYALDPAVQAFVADLLARLV